MTRGDTSHYPQAPVHPIEDWYAFLNDFEARYGFGPNEYVAKAILSTAHPDLSRWDAYPADAKAIFVEGDETRAASALAYIAGGSLSDVLPYLGPRANHLVTQNAIDEDKVRELVQAHP